MPHESDPSGFQEQLAHRPGRTTQLGYNKTRPSLEHQTARLWTQASAGKEEGVRQVI